MKIVVAGSNGFLGKNINKYFLRENIQNVIYLSRSDFDFSNSLCLNDFCEQHKPDLLIHTAVSLDDFQNNISMYLALEKCSLHCGKVIMIGSGAEYSHQRYKPLMAETYYDLFAPPSNNNPYHHAKHLISRLHLASNIPNIYNFRVFGLYGPYEDYTRRLISNNIYKYITCGVMTASSNHAFDYLYVDDLISAILHFADFSSSPNHNTYNVCSGHSDRFIDILSEVVISLGGSASDITMDLSAPSDLNYSGDCTRFQSEFNYQIFQTNYSQSSFALKNWISSDILSPN